MAVGGLHKFKSRIIFRKSIRSDRAHARVYVHVHGIRDVHIL